MCLWFDLLLSNVASCKVICQTTPVLLDITKNYNVLPQYYSNVLLSTLEHYANTTLYYTYYSSTTLYYKVLLQDDSVLQSTTPVPLCITKNFVRTTLYYSSTSKYYANITLHYKVLRQ